MISHRFLLALCAAALCGAALADAPPAFGSPRSLGRSGPGLLVAAPVSGSSFAAGQRSTFRVLNPSSDRALGPVSAKALGQAGFKVESSTCSKGLAPRASCSLVVAWEPTAPGVSRAELVVASGPSLEVRSSLMGDTSLSIR